MMKISHNIRFTREVKERIVRLGKLKDRKFQTQVEHMLKEQLKNQEVVMFLDQVRCSLEAMEPVDRYEAMANIATIVDIELEN